MSVVDPTHLLGMGAAMLVVRESRGLMLLLLLLFLVTAFALEFILSYLTVCQAKKQKKR